MFASSNFSLLAKRGLLEPVNPKPPKRLKRRRNEKDTDSVKPLIQQHTEPAPTPISELTPILALDCEMVGIGKDGATHTLARVSIVNSKCEAVYDHYVKPREPVTDYRTPITGITKALLHNQGIDFAKCQREVNEILEGRILVGHSIKNDFAVLMLSHPRTLVRDTANYKKLCPDRPRQLKKLVSEHLNIEIQSGVHDSVEDARAVMKLYLLYRKQWELEIKQRHRGAIRKSAKKSAT